MQRLRIALSLCAWIVLDLVRGGGYGGGVLRGVQRHFNSLQDREGKESGSTLWGTREFSRFQLGQQLWLVIQSVPFVSHSFCSSSTLINTVSQTRAVKSSYLNNCGPLFLVGCGTNQIGVTVLPSCFRCCLVSGLYEDPSSVSVTFTTVVARRGQSQVLAAPRSLFRLLGLVSATAIACGGSQRQHPHPYGNPFYLVGFRLSPIIAVRIVCSSMWTYLADVWADLWPAALMTTNAFAPF